MRLRIYIYLSLSHSLSLSFTLFLPPSYCPGRRHLTSWSARLQLSRGALRPALHSPKAMQPCVCASFSPSLSLSLSLSLFLPLSLPLSYSSGRSHLTSLSAGLQLSHGALRTALYSSKVMHHAFAHLSRSLSPALSFPLSLSP